MQLCWVVSDEPHAHHVCGLAVLGVLAEVKSTLARCHATAPDQSHGL